MRRRLMLGTLFLLVSCGGERAAVDTVSAVDHQSALADHETSELAARLVDVPGYSYRDPRASDVEQGLDVLHRVEQAANRDGLFAAASFHGVVADDATQNLTEAGDSTREVGYLALTQFDVAPPTEVDLQRQLLEAMFGGPASEELIISGVMVLQFEDPSQPQSRYYLMWFDDGVQGSFEGAELEPLVTWLEGFLGASSAS